MRAVDPEELRRIAPGADQILKFDQRLVEGRSPISESERLRLYRTLAEVLARGPGEGGESVGLCLGHIQSGKTTAMTALCALASDAGYSMVVAVLGSTNLLLSQNTDRLKSGLGMSDSLKSDYRWLHFDAAELRRGSARKVQDALGSGRCLLVTVLKNSRRLATLASVMAQVSVDGRRVLVLDDEADQASLNTMVASESESATYRELNRLCEVFGDGRLYVQFTATPYAPLLIDPDDSMSPDFVSILEPGAGYTGARAFFIDHGEMVVRRVPASETPKSPPRTLPPGLRAALASYVVGAALLLLESDRQAPVSMLIHPTSRVAIHDRVATLVRRYLAGWADEVGEGRLPAEVRTALIDLVDSSSGAVAAPDEAQLRSSLARLLQLVEISVVNGQAAADRVEWSKSPAHILIGGNKLDRGFTVEGLTVTYMSRGHSPQLDTLVQRARAFGYRSEYLPFCRFYATQETIEAFEASVLTDELLRSELTKWLDEGRPLSEWPARAGFLMSDGMRPTRRSVVPWSRSDSHSGWSIFNQPSLDETLISLNRNLVLKLGIADAPYVNYGRLQHRTLDGISLRRAVSLVEEFDADGPPPWRRNGLLGYLQRLAGELDFEIPVVLLESPDGEPRRRKWINGIGFSNLMQGRDKQPDESGEQYPGDRDILGARSVLQVHHLKHPEVAEQSLFTLALRIGDEFPVTKEVRRP